MNKYFPVTLKTVSRKTSFHQYNGWQVFAELSGKNLIQKNKEFMLDYVINLLDDATVFSWASAKACHAVLLCRMEQGEIQSCSQIDKRFRIRRAHAQRHITGQDSMNRSQDKSTSGTGKVLPCIYFNKGMCMQKQIHETKGVLYNQPRNKSCPL